MNHAFNVAVGSVGSNDKVPLVLRTDRVALLWKGTHGEVSFKCCPLIQKLAVRDAPTALETVVIAARHHVSGGEAVEQGASVASGDQELHARLRYKRSQ